MLGMSRPTTHRYVSTLVREGYLHRDESRRYRLSLGAMDLGLATLSATGLCKHARPHLQALAKRSGYTVQIAVLDGPEILLLDSVSRPRGRQGKAEVGVQAVSRLPAYCTSMGKVLLAYLPTAQRLRLLSEMELIAHGPKTITSEQVLLEQLQRVPEEGLAVNHEEFAAGSCAIAAPVRDESGDVVAAVGVVARNRVSNLDDLVDWLGGQLVLTAERISERLGWVGGE